MVLSLVIFTVPGYWIQLLPPNSIKVQGLNAACEKDVNDIEIDVVFPAGVLKFPLSCTTGLSLFSLNMAEQIDYK